MNNNDNDKNGKDNLEGLAWKSHGSSILWAPIIIRQRLFWFFLFFKNCFLISSQFYFCDTFVSYNKAFRVLGYSVISCLRISRHTAVAPIYRSIIPQNRISLLNVAHCSLPKFSDSFGDMWLIQTILFSFFKEENFTWKFPWRKDHAYLHISARKF